MKNICNNLSYQNQLIKSKNNSNNVLKNKNNKFWHYSTRQALINTNNSQIHN